MQSNCIRSLITKGLVICVACLVVVITSETTQVAAQGSGTDYLALVTNQWSGTVSVVDITSGTIIQTITVGPAQLFSNSPGCIAVSPDETLALVTYERQAAHQVIALDLTKIADGIDDNEIIDVIPLAQTVPEGANCMAFTPDGTRAYVAGSTNGADVAVIDVDKINDGIANNEISWVDTGGYYWRSLATTPDGTRVYVVTNSVVHVIDADPANPTFNTVVDNVDLNLSSRSLDIGITLDSSRGYVGDANNDKLYVVDLVPSSPTYNTVLSEILLDPAGPGAGTITISPDGLRAYVSRRGEVSIVDIDPTSPTKHQLIGSISGQFILEDTGTAVTPDNQSLLVINGSGGQDSLSIIDINTTTELHRVYFDGPTTAMGVAIYRSPVPENHVKVVDEAGSPVKGALVYQNGLAIGSTDERGLIVPQKMQPGDTLTAQLMTYEQPTIRAAHRTPDSNRGWAYRTYLTNLGQEADGQPIPYIITELGQQRITLHPTRPLILFNLVVSIEWDATAEYINQIEWAVQHASDYLYDFTDGQMAFGRVSIYDDGNNWANADIQISTQNIVRPHAYIGGITSNDRSHVIRVGRFWDGNSGDKGTWDQKEGYRTLAHEFGHYALHLYDEYFAYVFKNGVLVGEAPSLCTGPENRNPATDAKNASVMDYQYTTTELSARGVPGLWSPLCEQTAQWQLNGESPWETLVRKYADTINPPRWQLTSPIDRGRVLAGPAELPDHILALPTVTKHNSGASGPPQKLTVYGPDGQGHWGAIVALYKQSGRVIGQGFTDGNGQLWVYGSEAGDTIRVASFDGGLAGNVTVGPNESLSLTLASVSGLAVQAAKGIPHLQVRANPNPNSDQVDLFISLQNFGPNADPEVIITEPGSEVGQAPTLSYSPVSGAYESQISFSATERGLGRIRALGAVGNSLVRLQSTYRLQRATNISPTHIFSNDGNLSLYMEPGSLPGSEAYFVVMPPGAVPGPLPAGLVLVGDPYDITASGAVVTLSKPAILNLHYDGALVNPAVIPEGLGIYRWDQNKQAWQAVSSVPDTALKAMTAPVTVLGTYALLAPPGSWMEIPWENVFLPLILK